VANALGTRGSTLLGRGRIREAEAVLREALPVAEAAGELRGVYSIQVLLGWVYRIRGELGQAAWHMARSLDAAERWGELPLILGARAKRARVLYLRGDWAQARSELDQALALVRRVGRSWLSAEPAFGWVELKLAQGEWEERYLEEVAAPDELTLNLEPLGFLHSALAERDLLRQEQGYAHIVAERLVSLLARFQAVEADATMLAPYLAWARLAEGQEDVAETLLDQVIWRAAAEGMRLVLADALRVRALLRLRQGRLEEAGAVAAEAFAVSQAIAVLYAEAKVLYVSGAIHTEHGEPHLARARLQQALAICERLGEGLYRARIERMLAGR
jgi:tetratricopeptide (TPR) repeat protein